jgi:hypothetical protein
MSTFSYFNTEIDGDNLHLPPVDDFMHQITLEYIPIGGMFMRSSIGLDGQQYSSADQSTLIVHTSTAHTNYHLWNRVNKDSSNDLTRTLINSMFITLREISYKQKYQFIYCPHLFQQMYDRKDICTLVNQILQKLEEPEYQNSEHRYFVEFSVLRNKCNDYLELFQKVVGIPEHGVTKPPLSAKNKKALVEAICRIGFMSNDLPADSTVRQLVIMVSNWIYQRFNAIGIPAYHLADYPNGTDALNYLEFTKAIEQEISHIGLENLNRKNIIDLQYLQVNIKRQRKLVYTDLKTNQMVTVKCSNKLKSILATNPTADALFAEWNPKVQSAVFSQILVNEPGQFRLSLVCFGTL